MQVLPAAAVPLCSRGTMASKSSKLFVLLLVGIALFMIAPMVVILMLGGGNDVAPAPSGGPDPAVKESPAAPAKGPGASAPAGTPAGPAAGTVATRTLAPKPLIDDLPATPSACLLVIDEATQQPVSGAGVRRIQGGAEIGFTDERGLVAVPLPRAEQLAVVADGYLLRLAPTQLGTTEAEPQRVRLVRDRWSIVRRFEFVTRDGRRAGEAFVRFRPQLPPGGKPAAYGPPPTEAVTNRAWSEHTMLAAMPVCADVAVQLGVWSQDRVHRLKHHDPVLFTVPGEFVAEVATTTGAVGSAKFVVEAGAVGVGTPAPVVRVDLTPGAFAAGVVVGRDNAPVAGAQLSVVGGEPLGLLATTGRDGGFRLGPLPAGEVTLAVKHGDHQPANWGPVASDSSGLRIALQPLPQSTLRGRVRLRPQLQPLAEAKVSWLPQGGTPVTATAGADGTFQLVATGADAARLAITSPECVTYVELVQPGAPFAEYDVWPASPEARLAKGLTARLVGVVVDATGKPLPGISVRWIPAQRSQPAGLPGRRVLEGAVLELSPIAATGTDGAFRIETDQFGPGRLCFADAGPQAQGGVAAEAVAGKTQDGLRLQR